MKESIRLYMMSYQTQRSDSIKKQQEFDTQIINNQNADTLQVQQANLRIYTREQNRRQGQFVRYRGHNILDSVG